MSTENLSGCTDRPGKKGASSPRLILKISLILGPLFVGLHGLLLLSAKTVQSTVFINDFLPIFAGLAAFVALLFGSSRSIAVSRRSRAAWGISAVGALFTAAGEIAHFVLEVVYHQPPSPGLADIFFLCGYPFYIIGSVYISDLRIRFADILRLILEFLIIIVSCSLIVWRFIISPSLGAAPADSSALLLAVAYPVLDFAVLWAALIVIQLPNPHQSRLPILTFFMAAIIINTGDCMAAGISVTETTPSTNWLNLLYTICPLLVMYSGLLQADQSAAAKKTVAVERPRWLVRSVDVIRVTLPYLWLAGAYLTLYLELFGRPTLSDKLLFEWVAAINILVIARQIMAIAENQRLSEGMFRLNYDLEKRIHDRTELLIRMNNDLRDEMSERERVETALLEREEKLAHNALHDGLTDLPNRTMLIERLKQDLSRAKRVDYHFATLFLDFDGFKMVNDSLGHNSGDRLLVIIGNRLRSALRDIDMVARLGGDEFVIVMENVSNLEDITRSMERLQTTINAPYQIENHKIYLTTSIGLVLGDASYQQPEDILRDADLAMYEAKSQGKARYALFTPDLRQAVLDHVVMENNMRQAVERGEFELRYQPIIDLASGRVTCFEALISWNHPERGTIPPVEFIPIAEACGLIAPITRWVLHEACRQLRKWQTDFPTRTDLSVSVNLSPSLFRLPELQKMVDDALSNSWVSPGCLKLEITEGTIVEEAENTRSLLESWRQRGIQVLMDDFGTGYSSLSYLHRFPIDILKIDRSFVARIRGNGDQGEIARTIIALARELNIEVIAEGVETGDQLAYLTSMGCQYAQGFYISRPMKASAVSAFLLETGH
jgi:diguanylate cyclase (GGDEF)-like protein